MPRQSNRLLFLTSFSYPTHHAHPTHGLEMARAWAGLFGGSFTFVIERNSGPKLLQGIRYRAAFGRWGSAIRILHLRTIAYSIWLSLFLVRSKKPRPAIFVNDIRIGIAAGILRRFFDFTFIFESHGLYGRSAERFVYISADSIIFVTRALRERAVGLYPILASKNIVLPNAVDVERYDAVGSSKEQLRAELSLPAGTLIGYIGRFKPGGVDKGVEFMLRALPQLPDEYQVLFVGGTREEVEIAEKIAIGYGARSRAIFVPFVEGSLVPRYSKACDILAYVPSDVTSSFHRVETSPMKLFEYMAARRPIVVSDIPAVREILDETCAYFCVPGAADSFVRAVENIGQDSSVEMKTGAAYDRIRANSWTQRAEAICAAAKV